MSFYNHNDVEKKWREVWAKKDLYATDEDFKKEKCYVLDMYPYPSGEGLHVGHIENYTATDIYSRFKRMNGFNVLHPIGWDAFGLPAENYAIKTGVHPKETTAKAIKNFTEQIKSTGISYDWSREIGTHTPEYYRWTQWFFLLLYKNGLAYKKEAKVNWDPVDQTVLANEQVLADGTAERSGAKVEKREMAQWFFKITDYADALVDDLDSIDWPESTVTNQRNWIGRSSGAEIDFKIKDSGLDISVFTTRPDTLFGTTYIVLAPEHELVEKLKSSIENWQEVEKYIKEAENKTDLDRQKDEKEKTGVELIGVKAINPANQEEIPIFIADYVLSGYGTGAIMAVPAHDERDFAFAKKFNLSIQEVLSSKDNITEIYTGDGALINSGEFDGLTSEEVKEKITKKVGGEMKTTYKLRDWLISRQRYWGAPIPIVYDPEGNPHAVPEEHLPWLLPDDVDFEPKGYSPLSKSKELKERTKKIFGEGWTPEVDTMDTFVCSSWYFLRFTDPKNDKEFASKSQMKKWMPVDLYMGGAEHTVLHLLYSRFFVKVLKKLGYIEFDEPFSKLRHQGMILAEDGRKMSKSLGNVINPNEVIENYGADTLRVYEMFMGPIEDAKPWNTESIIGPRRFLERVWRMSEIKEIKSEIKIVENTLHQTIKKITEDIESLKFNTAISSMMIFVNIAEKEKSITKKQLETFLVLLAPFAPYITEELWEKIGNNSSIHLEKWPEYDESKIVSDTVFVAVQINGKTRGGVESISGANEKAILELIKSDSKLSKWLNGEVKKVIYIENRLINIVV